MGVIQLRAQLAGPGLGRGRALAGRRELAAQLVGLALGGRLDGLQGRDAGLGLVQLAGELVGQLCGFLARCFRLLAHGLQRLALGGQAVVRHFQRHGPQVAAQLGQLVSDRLRCRLADRGGLAGLACAPLVHRLADGGEAAAAELLAHVRQRGVLAGRVQFVGHRKYLLLRDRHVGPPLAGCML